MNERITENLVREYLQEKGFYDDENISVEEQKSANSVIQKCLKNASKTGGKGTGRPEFIIYSSNEPDFVIIIECKADIEKHQSEMFDQYKDFSVDGVLNYAAYLAREFNVIAIAVSGQTKQELKISTFLWVHHVGTHKPLIDLQKHPVNRFCSFEQYIKFATFDHTLESKRYESLIAFSKDVHNYMRDYASLSENEKPILVSGILIALLDNAFSRNYKYYKRKDLPRELYNAISRIIDDAEIPNVKKQHMLNIAARRRQTEARCASLGNPTTFRLYFSQ